MKVDSWQTASYDEILMLKLIAQYITRTCLNDKRGCDPDNRFINS